MIKRKTRYVERWQLEQYIKDNCRKDVNDMSASEALDELFGNFHYRGQFKIVDRTWSPSETRIHRLNRLWAYPLTLLAAPFMYIKSGQVGWCDDTKFGNWLLRVTGYRD